MGCGFLHTQREPGLPRHDQEPVAGRLLWERCAGSVAALERQKLALLTCAGSPPEGPGPSLVCQGHARASATAPRTPSHTHAPHAARERHEAEP